MEDAPYVRLFPGCLGIRAPYLLQISFLRLFNFKVTEENFPLAPRTPTNLGFLRLAALAPDPVCRTKIIEWLMQGQKYGEIEKGNRKKKL